MSELQKSTMEDEAIVTYVVYGDTIKFSVVLE
jgi:hypothetical protein